MKIKNTSVSLYLWCTLVREVRTKIIADILTFYLTAL